MTAEREPPAGGRLFVVGRPRTGSTLLQHLLNRSPRVCLAPESHFMRRARHLRLAQRLAMADGPAQMRAVVDALYAPDRFSEKGLWNWLRHNVPADEFAERLLAGERTPRGLLSLGMQLYAEHRCSVEPPPILGEKTPEHLAFVPQLRRWYPEARFIHTFRDPRAIYVSELRRRRAGAWGIKQRLSWLPGALLDPVLAPIEVGHTAVTWRHAARLDATYRRTLADRYLLVRFEDLVASPEAELRRVCDFLGIGFDPSLLDVRMTGSSYAAERHSGEGLDARAADRWREHITPLAARFLRDALGADMARYGYRD